MWAMLQAAGAVLAKFGAKHPAVKWGVITLVGLLAVEFVAERGVDLYVKMSTARVTVMEKNAVLADPGELRPRGPDGKPLLRVDEPARTDEEVEKAFKAVPNFTPTR